MTAEEVDVSDHAPVRASDGTVKSVDAAGHTIVVSTGKPGKEQTVTVQVTGGGGTVTEGTVIGGTVTAGTLTVGTGTGSPWASAIDAAIPPSAETTTSRTADLTSV